MSKAVKSVTKAFKSVTKSVVGRVVIGAAVAFLTAGVGSTILGAMGASTAFVGSTMGTILSYGISGAIAGGITSAISGGNVLKGMALGGLGGAVTGGVMSAMGQSAAIPEWGQKLIGGDTVANAQTGMTGMDAAAELGGGKDSILQSNSPDAIGGNAVGAKGAADSTGAALAPDATAAAVTPDVSGFSPSTNPELGGGLLRQQTAANISWVPETSQYAIDMAAANEQTSQNLLGELATKAGVGETRGLLSSAGQWMEKNGTWAGPVMSGVGGAMLSGGDDGEKAARIKADSEMAQLQQQQSTLAGNYKTTGMGLLTPESMAYLQNQPARPNPVEKFDPASYRGSYIYDREKGRVVFVPAKTAIA